MSDALTLLRPQWPAPANICAVVTERRGGVSQPPYDTLNLALHVDDDSGRVEQNRRLLSSQLGIEHIQWLEQVHGTDIADAADDQRVRTADGAITDQPGLACAVLTADCLPVLLCDQSGQQVAAVHAGWRGLSAGILGQAVARFSAPPAELLAWMGPAIGPDAFEVGVDVLEACFQLAHSPEDTDAISHCFRPGARPFKFYADLQGLARFALQQGVNAIYGEPLCTVGNADRFYSYRREGTTGRFASLIWRT